MKQINDASRVFVADVKKDQTIKFIPFDFIRKFRNHYLINSVFQEVVFSKPTKYFKGEAESFLLSLCLEMTKSLISTSNRSSDDVPFSDESIANTLMKCAQNAANYSALMEVQKNSYYAGRQFSEKMLTDRIKADWELEQMILTTQPDKGKAAQTDWMATLFGQQVSRKKIKIQPVDGVNLSTWQGFATTATAVLGSGPGMYTEQRDIAEFVQQRSQLENLFYGVNFPGFYNLVDSSDAFYILALMYLDYVHVTSSPEQYQSVMRPEAPNTPQRMDAMATRAKRFMKYYAAMAVAPRFMSMYAKYLLMKDLNVVLATWTDNDLSTNKDMVHKMSTIESLCKSIVPQRFLSHTEDIIRWYKDFYGVGLLLPEEYSGLASFTALKAPNTADFLVKAGDPILQSIGYKDKVLTQKDLMNMCLTRDSFIDLMYHACISLNTHIQQIDKSVSTVQSWDEFTSFEIPTIPAATEFGLVKFAEVHKTNIVNDVIPRNRIDYLSTADGTVPKRGFLGNVDVIPILKDLVFGTIKPNLWLSSLRSEKKGQRPAQSFNPNEVRMIFNNDHTLYIGSRPMAHYAEMPIPVDYLAYVDPSSVDPTLAGLSSVLQALPSPYKALSDYFSAAAAQFDMAHNIADLASSFASVGFWFQGGLTASNKADDFNDNWIAPSTRFIYGVPTRIFYQKNIEKITTEAMYGKRAIVIRSAASDKEFTFVMHTFFPVISEVFQHAQTFCDGFIADIPVLGTPLLAGIKKDGGYDDNNFKVIVVQGEADGLSSKDFTWFSLTGWSKHTAILPHMTFRVSSQSSALSDMIINDPDIMKRFVIMAYSNDKEIRPISRTLINSPLVYFEPEDVMISRDTSITLTRAKIADLTDELSKSVERVAESSRLPKLDDIKEDTLDENSRGDKLKPGHDAGINVNDASKPIKTTEDFKEHKPFIATEAAPQEKRNPKDVIKDKDLESDIIKSDALTENAADVAVNGNHPGAPVEKKDKKKIKRTKADGSTEEIEVDADYTLGENEVFVD